MPPSPPTSAAPLRGTDSLAHTLIMASPLAIYLLDPEQRIQLWNPAAERIFGWKAEEVVGRVNPTVPAEALAEADAMARMVLGGESVAEREVRCCRSDGSLLDVELAAARFCDPAGHPQGIMVIALDVTDRRRMEAERAELLRREREARAQAEAAERRARFLAGASALLDDPLDHHATLGNLARFTVPALADLCLIDELDGGEVTRVAIAHADPAREAWIERDGYSLSACPEAHPVALVLRTGQPVRVEEVTEADLDDLCGGDPERRERLRRLELRSFAALPLTARGRTLGALVLATAESGRRFAPADLELAEELARRAASAIDTARLYHQARQAVRARERLLAVVSHDLRNSLATVLLNASSMLEGPPTAVSLGEPEREQMQWIARSAEQMSRLINDLLDVSTIESGQLSIELSVHDAGSLLREALHLGRPLALEKGLRCSWEVAEGTPPIRVDHERIQQVLGNLLGNAIKFSPPGGSIVLRAQAAGGGEVRISVSDSGPGISEQHRSAIFDLFWQGHRGRRTGTGLGLAIARGIVEAHGGRIWVESRDGGGSTFFFTVPAAGSEG